MQQEAGIYRFCSGFFLWRLGAGGCVYDPWRADWGDPYHPFDNHVGEWGSLCVPANQPRAVPTTRGPAHTPHAGTDGVAAAENVIRRTPDDPGLVGAPPGYKRRVIR